MDTKYDFVIALATKEGGFGIVIESEVEMNKWLNNLLSLQRKYCGEFDLPLFGELISQAKPSWHGRGISFEILLN